MTCVDDDDAAAWVGDALGAEERARIAAHVASCDACKRHLEALAESTGSSARRKKSRWDGLAAGMQIGRFVLEAPLGSGGMGVVWSSHDPDLGRRVALKMVRADVGDEALQNRLLREARAMARLSHPNVVAVFDLVVHQRRLAIAMELVDGESLASWLAVERRPFADVRDAFLAAGRGLAAAHAVGLVHRDFKPENVLVARTGRVAVTDFGLASIAPRAEANGDDRATTSTAGTPAYMAPEQLRGEAADARSDQFAFAVALWRALFDVPPYDGPSAVLAGRLREATPRAGVPSWVRPVLERALATDPDARYPSMTALLDELARDRAARTRRTVRGAVAIAAVAACIGVGVLAGQSRAGHASGCGSDVRSLDGLWDAASHERVAQAFRATHAPYADDAWRATAKTLDRYASAWSESIDASCQAGEDPAEMRRRACLDERRIELQALVDVLAAADRAAVAAAPAAAEMLTPPARCSAPQVIRSAVAPPVEPRNAASVADVRARLAHAWALHRTRNGRQALPLAQGIVDAARASGHRPVEAEALLLQGALLTQSFDRAAEGERVLYRAVATADAAGDDRTRAKAWSELLYNVGHLRVRHETDPWWMRDQAEAALARLGGDESTAVQLENSVASVHYRRGEFADAQRHSRTARDLAARAYGRTSLRYATTTRNLAMVDLAIGANEEALTLATESGAIVVGALGQTHEEVAQTESVIGEAHFVELRHGEAETHQRRALAIAAEVGVPKLSEAKYAADLARTLAEVGKHAEALALAERSLALFDAATPADHPERFGPLLAAGTAYLAAAEPAKAVAPLERALALDVAGKAVEAAEAERLLAEALSTTNPARARALAAHAAEVYASNGGGARHDREVARLATFRERIASR